MDAVPMTRAQVKALNAMGVDVTITNVNVDARMICVERTKYLGHRGEARWILANGRNRPDPVTA